MSVSTVAARREMNEAMQPRLKRAKVDSNLNIVSADVLGLIMDRLWADGCARDALKLNAVNRGLRHASDRWNARRPSFVRVIPCIAPEAVHNADMDVPYPQRIEATRARNMNIYRRIFYFLARGGLLTEFHTAVSGWRELSKVRLVCKDWYQAWRAIVGTELETPCSICFGEYSPLSTTTMRCHPGSWQVTARCDSPEARRDAYASVRAYDMSKGYTRFRWGANNTIQCAPYPPVRMSLVMCHRVGCEFRPRKERLPLVISYPQGNGNDTGEVKCYPMYQNCWE